MLQENISYEQIRSKKIEQYGTEFKDWIWILVKQYKDRTHFLFELLQNAEDAKASEVRFSLLRDMLVIEHNGILFSKADVINITKVAKSGKTSGEGAIGRFGIGFKSVYAYAATPRIYSGKYAFEIRDFIYPYEIAPIRLENGWTRIEIPFNNDEIDPERAFTEISKALREQICSNTLLFLNNIQDIQIQLYGSTDVITISKADRERKGTGGSVIDVNILYERKNKRIEENYLLFTDCEEEAVCIAFKVEGQELVPVPNTSIFTYFPTDKESHQSFYIHAPFDTTPARDNIVEDSERNQRFVRNICDGIQMAFCWMRDNGYLSLNGLNATYPIYHYPEDTIFHLIYERAIKIIQSGEKLIPTNKKGVFKGCNEILLPDNMTIVDIFDDEDVQKLFLNHRLFWIAKEISTDSCQQLRQFFKNNFNFKTYTWKDVISRLDARFLQQKDYKWFERLFNAIRSFSVSRTKTVGSHDVDVTLIPFVRLQDGRQVCAYDNDGHPVVYLNNPPSCSNKIDRTFIDSIAIKRFYSTILHITEYNVVTTVTDDILPKYRSGEAAKAVTVKENIQDLKTIKNAIQVSPELRDKVKNYYIVSDGSNWFKPGDLHIPSGFGRTRPEYNLIDDTRILDFLSSDYQHEPKLDERFFIEIGCADSLRLINISTKEYLNLVGKYIGWEEKESIRTKIFSKTYQEGIHWDILFEGFPEIMYRLDDKKSKRLAKFLNRYTTQISIRGEIIGAQDQHFIGANVDSMNIYSAIGILLTFVPWIYTKDGVKKNVTDIRRSEIDSAYEKDAKRLLDILPFVEENKALEEILSGIKNEAQKEMLKELLTNENSLDQVSKAWHDMKLKELKKKEKKKLTPQEALEEAAKKKGIGAAKEKPEEAEAITNPERRKKKLEDEFMESMSFKINVSKTTLKYTYQDRISSEEKAFLRVQYNGYCQICGTTILKYDGEHHFQAINVMKTANLAEAYKGALETGWNSLCLCPNCAAKYQYGVKDVSNLYEQVQKKEVEAGSDETIDISLSLQDKQEIIHYTPKHFLALKTAMEVYSKK